MSFYLDIDEETAPIVLDSQNTGITRQIEDARSYLVNALMLWQMLDPNRAVALKQMLNEELRNPRGAAQRRLQYTQVERLIAHLQGLETAAIGKIMDEDYHVLPDKVDDVKKQAPGLAVRTTDGQGHTIYVLDKITEIEWLRAFLETALQLGVDVIQA